MNQVIPWTNLVALIEPFARGAHQALGGCTPFPVEVMLRIHCLQLWWNLSDPAIEEELHERPLYRHFVGLDGSARLPDETTILRFGKTPSTHHLLEKLELAPQALAIINADLAQQGLMLKTGTVVDASIIAAPSSTKNKDGQRDPEMHQTKKGNQWHFESPRVLRRRQSLRGLSHEEVKQVFTRGSRTRSAHRAVAPRRLPLALGSH